MMMKMTMMLITTAAMLVAMRTWNMMMAMTIVMTMTMAC